MRRSILLLARLGFTIGFLLGTSPQAYPEDYTNSEGHTINTVISPLSSGDTYTNDGTIDISSGDPVFTTSSASNITITNSSIGTIHTETTDSNVVVVYNNQGTNNTIVNAGTITISGGGSTGIYSHGSFSNPASLSFTNSGQLEGNLDYDTAVFNDEYSVIENLENSGSLYATYTTIQNQSNSSITLLTNDSMASIISQNIALLNNGTINTLANSGYLMGSIGGSPVETLLNTGTITLLTNYSGGQLGSVNDAEGISNQGTITTLTNLGTIGGENYSISNSGTLTTLINGQNTLTLTGNLPSLYEVLLTSTTEYGKLSVTSGTGNIEFGIASNSVTTPTTYSGVLQGVTSEQLSNTTGTYNGYFYRLFLEPDMTDIWDLSIYAVDPTNTMTALQLNAVGLATVFNLETAATVNGLHYDCQSSTLGAPFCLSAEADYFDEGGSYLTNVLVGGAYQVTSQVRVGGFVDPIILSNLPSGLKLSLDFPRIGLFATWTPDPGPLGYEIRVSTNREKEHLKIDRLALSETEPGAGKTALTSQAELVRGSYGFPISEEWFISPYAGIRYGIIKVSAYQENASSQVQVPLSYSTLSQKSTTAIAGVQLTGKASLSTKVTTEAGLEQDMRVKATDYSAAGAIALNPIPFNPHVRKTRGLVALGAEYHWSPSEQIELNALYRQESFQSTHTLTGTVRYQIRF